MMGVHHRADPKQELFERAEVGLGRPAVAGEQGEGRKRAQHLACVAGRDRADPHRDVPDQLGLGASCAAGKDRAEGRVIGDADQQLRPAVGHSLDHEAFGLGAAGGDGRGHLMGRPFSFSRAREPEPDRADLGLVEDAGTLRLERDRPADLLGGRPGGGGICGDPPLGCGDSVALEQPSGLLHLHPFVLALERARDHGGGLLAAGVAENGRRFRWAATPVDVAHHAGEGAGGVLRVEVGGDAVTGHGGVVLGRHKYRLDRDRPRDLGDCLADRRGDVLRAGQQRPDEDDDQCIDALPVGHRVDRLAVVLGARRGDHVDRISERCLGRQEAVQPLPQVIRSLRHLEAARLAGVGAHDPRPSGVGEDADPAALRQGLVLEQRGNVEELGEGVGADHAGLLEEGIDGDVRRRQQRPRVGAGGARTGRRAPALDGDDRHPAPETSCDP